MENKRRKIHEQLEVVQTGFANGCVHQGGSRGESWNGCSDG